MLVRFGETGACSRLGALEVSVHGRPHLRLFCGGLNGRASFHGGREDDETGWSV